MGSYYGIEIVIFVCEHITIHACDVEAMPGTISLAIRNNGRLLIQNFKTIYLSTRFE